MYIKLGTIQALRQYDDPNDFMILSEVPSSSMSYESPIRVRSLDELNIWFGKTYPEYSYLRELIESGVTLYLYKPVASEKNPTEDWEDVYFEDEIGFATLPESGEPGYRYHTGDGEIYVWYEDDSGIGGWIRDIDWPEITSDSLLNRDTLVISDSYSCCPKYLGPGIYKTNTDIDINLDSQGDGVYSEIIEITEEELGEGYLGIQNSLGEWILLYSGELPQELQGIRKITYKEISGISGLREALEEIFEVSEIEERKWYLRGTEKREPTSMCSFPGISFSTDKEGNEALVYGKMQDSGYIGFWSRTIGRDRNNYDIDESRIRIDIENLGPDGWKIEASRYGYLEYWIGNLKGSPGEESVFDRINKESKLVQCEVSGSLDNLLEGSWYLDGAEVEETGTSEYRNSMGLLLGTLDDSIFPDFFMVPDLSLFGEREDEQLFLPYAQAGNLQFLIHETDEEYKDNYLEDKENRLLYFYGEITYREEQRPGWYLYLRNLLKNTNTYYDRDIIYPVKLNQKVVCYDESWEVHNPYITLDEVLDHYKCNYLVWNNQYYYYNKYQNGEDYETSGMMRFIMGKVYREIQKNKWKIIGRKYSTMIRNTIEDILLNIGKFECVDDIRIVSFIPLLEISTIDLEVAVYTKELLKNDVVLDITINYKKYEY